MRALCTVRGPLAAGGGAGEEARGARSALAPSARLLALRAPGLAQPLHFVVEAKSRARDLKALAHEHFHLQGISDTQLFGLAVVANGEYLFVDLDSKLSKYAPKSWRSSHTHGLDANGRPLLELHLAVQFHVESPLLLASDAARRLYYLQLRANLLARDSLPAERLLLLAGLALQADCGDADRHADRDYFALRDYAPPSLTGDWVAAAMRACHRDNRGLSPARAETRFIREVCLLPDSVDSHKYRMKRSKSEPDPGGAWLLVTAKGISIMPDDGPVATFVWSSIGKLSFDRKKFEIRTQDGKITMYSSSDDKSKYLFALCRETHQFSMKMAPRLAEVLPQEEEERKCCYGYSKILDFRSNNSKSEQRVSVISSVSSNTTSGIVSDRVQSEDELEIMIDCPPALSTESLAFAHLLDSSSNYFHGECSKEKPRLNKTVSLQCKRNKSDEDCNETTDIPSKAEEESHEANEQPGDSPVSGKLKCTGSQCSSSCSTVVIARAGLTVRRSSNASSLELGFSHTAQNSMISDNSASARDADYMRDTASALYDGIGPVTVAASSETSGVYTMGSSETTAHTSKVDTVSDASRTECGSSHYGSYKMNDDLTRFDSVSSLIDSVIEDRKSLTEESLMFRLKNECNVSNADCVDGVKMFLCDDNAPETFRQRTGSASSAASFHGDGSDPADGRHALLSASELSDLIVGRGVYPKRQSVSDTLDSVSDYVRLPLPLSGESYLQGHEDTAPSDDHYLANDAFFERPPTPPARIDSRKLSLSLPDIADAHETAGARSTFPAKPPPPYEFDHKTFSPAERSPPTENPPPYPVKAPGHARYEREEVAARVVTSKPMITILTAEAGDVSTPIERTFAGPMLVEHRFQKSRRQQASGRRAERSRLAQDGCHQQDASVLVAMLKLPPPPPPRAARLPPPPPPHLQQFHQQLYSDVDYVIYPWQDPIVSQQNYLESKLAGRHASALQYRSTPFLSAPLAPSVYGSTQNLSDSYVQLPGARAALYFPERPPRPAPRTRSHDNLLDSPPRLRRLPPPPPPPPPYEHKKKLPSHLRDAGGSAAPEGPRRDCAIDIKTLREKSKNLDLPLIAALCNDRSLLKQTKAFGAPKSSRYDEGESAKKQAAHGATTDSLNFRYKQDTTVKTLQTTQGRKLLVRNPNDKLPDIPGTELHTPRALCNTYVAPPGNKKLPPRA